MSDFQAVVDVAMMIGSFATAALVFFVWHQTRQTDTQLKMTQKQIDSTLRGWLGIKYHGIHLQLDDAKSEGKVIVRIKNYGSIPATKVTNWLVAQTEPIDVETMDLEYTDGIAQTGTILPDVERDREAEIEGYANISKENPIVYIYHVTQYEYANQIGLYAYYGSINIKTNKQRAYFEHAS